MNMKPAIKVLWISKQNPVEAQYEWLNSRLEDKFNVVHNKVSVRLNVASDLFPVINEQRPDILVPILSLSFKRFLVRHRYRLFNPELIILEPIMERVDGNRVRFNPRTDFYIGDPSRNIILRFKKFVVLEDIDIKTKPFNVDEISKVIGG